MRLVKRPATDPKRRIGSLIVNPGGPGLSGVLLVQNIASRAADHFGENVADRFDIVGFAPRGVGSTGIRCLTDAAIDQTVFSAAPPIGSTLALDQACAKLGDTGQYSTENVARDLERLRVTLGDPALTFYGVSYGTVIGTTYASMYPNRVRAFILDSPYEPNTATTETWLTGDLAPFEVNFSLWADWCRGNKDCTAQLGDPKRTWESLNKQLEDEPLALEAARLPVNKRVLAMATMNALYREELWPDLASAIGSASNGDGNELFDLAAGYAGRGTDGSWGPSPHSMIAISCATGLRSNTAPPDIQAALSRIHKGAPHFAAMATAEDLVPPCQTMGAARLRPISPLRSGLAIVLGGTNDPATPLAMAGAVASKLGSRATLVSNEQNGHVQRRGNPCVTAIIESALVDLVAPAAGTVCRSDN
jgi:pimeloyl-ACP methyl ester carboxylesterase